MKYKDLLKEHPELENSEYKELIWAYYNLMMEENRASKLKLNAFCDMLRGAAKEQGIEIPTEGKSKFRIYGEEE